MTEDLRDHLAVYEKLAAVQQELAVLKTKFKFSPNRAALEALEGRVRKDMNEIAQTIERGMDKKIDAVKADFRTIVAECFADFSNQQKAQNQRLLNRAGIVVVVIASVVIGGVEAGIRAAQAMGLMPHF